MKDGLGGDIIKLQSVLLYDVDKAACQRQLNSSLRFLEFFTNLTIKSLYYRVNEFLEKLKSHISEQRENNKLILNLIIHFFPV